MTRVLDEEGIKKVCKKFCAEKSINELMGIVSVLKLRAENYMNHGESIKKLNMTNVIEFINLYINTTIEKVKQDSIPNKKDEIIIDPNTVNIGDEVTVKNSGGEDERFILCDKKLNSDNDNEISIGCPIGKELLGKRKGDSVNAIIPDGTYYTGKIIEIEKPKVLEIH